MVGPGKFHGAVLALVRLVWVVDFHVPFKFVLSGEAGGALLSGVLF
jgi:hypothetical protein